MLFGGGKFPLMSNVILSCRQKNLLLFRYAMCEEIYLLSNQQGGRKTSKLEVEWLSWETEMRDIYIQATFSHPMGQAKIERYFVDGYAPESKIVFEFNVRNTS
jgi:hypothetical protein